MGNARTTILDASLHVAAETASDPTQVAEVLMIVAEVCDRHLPGLFAAIERPDAAFTAPAGDVVDALMQAAMFGQRRSFASNASTIHDAIAERNPPHV